MYSQEKILSLLASGLEAAGHNHTVSSLGDRQSYLGMSDLAAGLTCPRAVVARKLQGEPASQPLETLLQLRRGHWLEYGVEEALAAAGQKYISQLEISVEYKGVPVKAHLDFVLFDEAANAVTVIELKSVGRIREHVYGSHEAQLYGQLGLLRTFWNSRCFRITGSQFGKKLTEHVDSDYCTLSEMAKRQVGVQLPDDADSVSIRGFVLTISPKEARAFGPYEPNQELLSVILDAGKGLWQSLAEIKSGQGILDDVATQHGFSPLCDFCTHNRSCPKFQGGDHPALEPELSALAELKRQRSRLEEEIKEREEQLKAIAALMGTPGQWINGEHHRFKVSRTAGRATLDQSLLKANLCHLKQVDENQLDTIIATAQKISRPFERLQLSPISGVQP